jgi:hypothetical protein
MQIKKLLTDYNIPFDTHGKNISTGWIGLQCPFCNDKSNHLGYDLNQKDSKKGFSCWKCGWHSTIDTISILLHLSKNTAKQIVQQYKGQDTTKTKTKELTKQTFVFPSNTGELMSNHLLYLERRNFDPEYLKNVWDIQGTGITSILIDSERNIYDYKLRILIPIYWAGQIVSFQTRDITDRADQRYKACPKPFEILHHKEILFINKKKLGNNTTGLCVEGVFDCFRLGLDSFATFGTKVTPLQVREMARIYKKIFVIFDPEEQAQKYAEKLIAELRFRGVKAENILLKKGQDPASLSAEEARYLSKQFV